jgi:hypothetical protein
MTGISLCLAALVLAFVLGSRSLVGGLGVVLTAGYLYGIARANFLDTFTYFLFDCAVAGFYAGVLIGRPRSGTSASAWQAVDGWVKVLIGWACLMALLPVQHPLIQLVGLRGNAFLVPFVVIGARLGGRAADRLALWLAALNLMSLAFAVAEFHLGVSAFYPLNTVTEVIFRSTAVEGTSALRIPACFANSHAYGSSMVATVPWLVGALARPGFRGWRHALVVGGLAAALVGNFLAATRVNIGLLAIIVVVATFSGQLRLSVWVAWILLLGGVLYLVGNEERLQRFLTLRDTDMVGDRLGVSLTMMEMVMVYPLGNGMGAGGTSIPYFLQSLLHDAVVLESEYCRIVLEQGLPGLGLWFLFMAWFALRPIPPGSPWGLGRRLLWVSTLGTFLIGYIGMGLMTSIPSSVLFFLGAGFVGSAQPQRQPRRSARLDAATARTCDGSRALDLASRGTIDNGNGER